MKIYLLHNQLYIKKLVPLINFSILIILFFLILAKASFAKPIYAAIVIDAASGKILFQKKASIKTYPASLVKIMTLYMLFEALEKKKLTLNNTIKISSNAARQAPKKLGLRAGQYISVRHAILAITTHSANDIATSIAEKLGGSERNFARIMNRKARQLGLQHTTFRNASGLPDSRQKTTARDIAILSRAIYHRFPTYYRYFRTRLFSFNGRCYRNTNKLLGKIAGVDGIKTGFINASGYNLSVSAVRNGRRLIAVILGGRTSQTRNKQMIKLLNDSFMNHEMPIYFPKQKPSFNQSLQRTRQRSDIIIPQPLPHFKLSILEIKTEN
jgi:D-alanyl-D-alanine carboxypeptidase